MRKLLENTGKKIFETVEFVGQVCMLLFGTLCTLPRFFSRAGETVNQMYLVGVQSLGVTLIFALFSGMIIALETGMEINKFGLIHRLGSIVMAAMTKQWGPMMTSIILTARAGSAMAAELSVMKVSEEIDALEVMSVNPTRYLVMPRIVATVIMCISLSILATYIGTWGGYVVYKYQFSDDIVAGSGAGMPLSSSAPSYQQYWSVATGSIEMIDLYGGLVKSVVFGLVIGAIACTHGLRATQGAQGVGIAVRNTVVSSLMIIIVLNYIISKLFIMEA